VGVSLKLKRMLKPRLLQVQKAKAQLLKINLRRPHKKRQSPQRLSQLK